MSDSDIPSDIEEAAEAALTTLIPQKSKQQYEAAYRKFNTWCDQKKVTSMSEKVFLAYFSEISSRIKPSTLWSQYSMLRTTIYVNKNVDIRKYTNVIAFLKRKAKGYRPKKSRIFFKEEMEKFIKEADDTSYLLMKVVLIVGISGACRREELTFLSIKDIEDASTFIKVNIPKTKTKVPRLFTITEGNIEGINCLENFRKYTALRSPHANQERFFVSYRNGKCTLQPVGINTIGAIPAKMASFLGLSNVNEFTGHCFCQCSASLLADAGADMSVLKRHGGWRSSSVAEEYVENSLGNKNVIARKILGSKNVDKEDVSTKKIKVSENEPIESDPSLSSVLSLSSFAIQRPKDNHQTSSSSALESNIVNFTNLNSCTINIYTK